MQKIQMSKERKMYSVPLVLALEMMEGSIYESNCYKDLLLEILTEGRTDERLLEILCDGFSVNNKIVREVDTMVTMNPLMKSDTGEEAVVLGSEDIQIFEALILSHHHLSQDLLKYNLSVAKN